VEDLWGHQGEHLRIVNRSIFAVRIQYAVFQKMTFLIFLRMKPSLETPNPKKNF
jgi:hypothetical protein